MVYECLVVIYVTTADLIDVISIGIEMTNISHKKHRYMIPVLILEYGFEYGFPLFTTQYTKSLKILTLLLKKFHKYKLLFQ